jgi:hypothetical protein
MAAIEALISVLRACSNFSCARRCNPCNGGVDLGIALLLAGLLRLPRLFVDNSGEFIDSRTRPKSPLRRAAADIKLIKRSAKPFALPCSMADLSVSRAVCQQCCPVAVPTMIRPASTGSFRGGQMRRAETKFTFNKKKGRLLATSVPHLPAPVSLTDLFRDQPQSCTDRRSVN